MKTIICRKGAKKEFVREMREVRAEEEEGGKEINMKNGRGSGRLVR